MSRTKAQLIGTVSGGANISGVVTATSANVGSGITLSGTQINVGSATTIHSSGFRIGSSDLHSTGLSVQNVNASGVITATTFVGDGSGLTGAGSTVVNDISTDETLYPVLTSQTSGTITSSKVSTTKLSFNPLTGVISGTGFSGSGASLTSLNASELSSGLVPAARITETSALTVGGDLYVTGNISFGGTTTQLNTSQLTFSDPDIILGVGTTSTFNPTDNTANHGGIAIASTEGSPLVNLNIEPTEVLPDTYKKFMWFKSNTSGLGTDAWLSNYAVGIGSTQFPTGIRLSAGNIQFSEDDLKIVRDISASGVVTATSFSGSGASLTSLNADNISSGTLSNSRLPSDINVSGAVTATSFSGSGASLTTLSASNISSGTLSNSRLPSEISISGVSTASRFVSTVATGTSPLSVTSTTLVSNLNADLLDGQEGSYYLNYNNFTNTPTIPTVNNGTLTLAVSGTGLSGSASFTANQSGNTTFTVTSNATSANTGSTIVARDASGNFSAGTITASFLQVNGNIRVGNSNTSNEIRFYGISGDGEGSYNHTAIMERQWGISDQSELLIFKGNDLDTATIHDRVRIAATGRIVLHSWNGYATVDDYITAAGTGNISGSAYINGNDLFCVGNVTAYSSDRRLKENFKHIETPLKKVLQLNGYTFDWNQKSKELGFTPALEKNDIGLIAQEVQEVLPQAVTIAPFDRDEDLQTNELISKSGENYLTIQYERLVPLLVEAIKEQQSQVEKQQEQINILKEEINNLKK